MIPIIVDSTDKTLRPLLCKEYVVLQDETVFDFLNEMATRHPLPHNKEFVLCVEDNARPGGPLVEASANATWSELYRRHKSVDDRLLYCLLDTKDVSQSYREFLMQLMRRLVAWVWQSA